MIDFLEKLFTNKSQVINEAMLENKFFYYSCLVFLFGLISKSLSLPIILLEHDVNQFFIFFGNLLGSIFFIGAIIFIQSGLLSLITRRNLRSVTVCSTLAFYNLLPLLPISYILFFIPKYKELLWIIPYLYFISRCVSDARKNVSEFIKIPKLLSFFLVGVPSIIIWFILFSDIISILTIGLL